MTDRESPEQPRQGEPPPHGQPPPGMPQPPPGGGYPPYGYGPPPGYPPGPPQPGGYPQYGGYVPPSAQPPAGYQAPYPQQGPPGYGWGPPPGGPPGPWQARPVAAPRPAAPPVEEIPRPERVMSAVAYLIPLLSSIGLLVAEKRRPAVRFHAAQALAVDVVIGAIVTLVTALVTRVPQLFFLFLFVYWGGFTVPRLFLLVQSARGVHVRVPWLADFADARARTALWQQQGPGT